MPTYNGERFESTDYRDADVLKYLYWNERLSLNDIADIFDIGDVTVLDWMKKNGIERRDAVEASNEKQETLYATYYTHTNGYQYWKSKGDTIKVCKLVAIAKYGIDEVKNMDAHHKNGIKWLDIPENLEIMTHKEHAGVHSRGESNNYSELTEEAVREIKKMSQETDMAQSEIGEKFGVSRGAVKAIQRGETWTHIDP